jgi:hypothetical protein
MKADIFSSGALDDGLFRVIVNNETVHVASSSYEADMFVAELKARLGIRKDAAGKKIEFGRALVQRDACPLSKLNDDGLMRTRCTFDRGHDGPHSFE